MALSEKQFVRLFTLLFLAGTLACGAGLESSSPTPPGGTVRVTATAAEELERSVRNQIMDASKRDFRLDVTNQQITSIVNLRATTLPLERPQIWFTRGKAYIRGTFTGICLWRPEVLIVASPRVKDRKLQVNVQQIYVGSFALPQDWLPTVSKSITDSIEDAQINLLFDRVDILEGELVLVGSKRSG